MLLVAYYSHDPLLGHTNYTSEYKLVSTADSGAMPASGHFLTIHPGQIEYCI